MSPPTLRHRALFSHEFRLADEGKDLAVIVVAKNNGALNYRVHFTPMTISELLEKAMPLAAEFINAMPAEGSLKDVQAAASAAHVKAVQLFEQDTPAAALNPEHN